MTVLESFDTEFGQERVLASAKSAVTKELMESTGNFQDTLPYEVSSDGKELMERLEYAETIQEKIAYTRLLAKNGPGTEKLRAALKILTKGQDPMSQDMLEFKEIAGTDQTFRNAGRDFEVWANNEIGPDGVPYTDFEAVSTNLKVWNDFSPQRFASMSKPSQMHALKLMQTQESNPEKVRIFAERVLNSTAKDNTSRAPHLTS